ncbi:MAG: LysR family transcriptional regulator [Pseudomonadota bacterium]
MIVNMNQLRSFFTAAKLNSISKAAQELMVTPPAVCIQVKQLEETVNVRLLVREGNTIRLTDAGVRVFKKAEQIFQGVHELEGLLGDLSTVKSGELRLGCPEVPLKFLMPLIIAFQKTYPRIRVILDRGSSSEMVKSVLDRRNELVVVRYRPGDSRLRVKAIGKGEVVLLASPQSVHLPVSEISIMQLSEIPLALREDGSAMREIVLDYFRKFKVNPSIAMESASLSVLKEFVRQDNGVGFLEEFAVNEELKNGSLKAVKIHEGSPTIEFGIGYRNRKYLSPPAWAFLRLLDKSKNLLSVRNTP